MQAEVAKLRSLPTARWTAIVVFGLLVFGFVALFIWGGSNGQDYEDTVDSVGAVTSIASMVIGVWMVGLEYGQNTLRRTLTADPRRGRLLLAKLAVGLGAVVLLTVGAVLLAAILFPIAASANDAASPGSYAIDTLPGAVLANVFYASLGIGVALVTRSMAGGMTVMLALVFVVDLIIGGISGIDTWSFGTAVSDVADKVNNVEDAGSIGHAVLVLVVWIGLVLGAGWARFTRTDVP